MTVSYSNIPSELRTPLFVAELDNSKANSAQDTQRALIVAPIISGSKGVADTPILCQGVSHAQSVGGQGSVLALMVAAYRAADSYGQLWILPVSDDPSAVKATGSISITSPATDTGVLSLYIAGVLVSLTVTSGLTAANVATSLAAKINGKGDLPVTAAVDSGTTTKVNLTAKNGGLVGNEIDLRLNFLGAAGGETLPTGLGVTVASMAGGAANPSLTNGLANLLDEEFDFIASAFSDTASLDSFKSLMSTKNGRWAWDKMLYGHVFTAYRGTLGTLSTYGTARNDEHMSIMGFNDSPSPAWIWAADITATAAVALRADPARPLQTLALSTVKAPPVASRFDLSDRNVLLYDGISTFTVAKDGTVSLERVITTYQTNSYGEADDSYLPVERLYTLAYALRQLRSVVTSKFGRAKLGTDGDTYDPGANVVTDSTIRAELLAQYKTLVKSGYCQNYKEFAEALLVDKNSDNPQRVDVVWPVVPINQLNVFALLAQFRAQ